MAAHPMWVNIFLSDSHCLANPKSHSFTRPGLLPSSRVLSNFKSLGREAQQASGRRGQSSVLVGLSQGVHARREREIKHTL